MSHACPHNARRWLRVYLLVIAVPVFSLAASHPSKANKIVMNPYENELLHVKLIVPEGWKINATDKAIAFYSPYGKPAMRAAMGIMKSSKAKLRIDKAVKEEFKAEGKPSEWVQADD